MLRKQLDKFNSLFKIDIDVMPSEKRIDKLPTTLIPFIWFFVRQVKGTVFTILIFEVICGLAISGMFRYVGYLVERSDYTAAMLVCGIALLLARLMSTLVLEGLYQLKFTPYLANMIRRQLFNYTIQQSLSFFHNDFAGRISTKIMQTAHALRNAIKSIVGSVWFASIFTIANIFFMAQQNLLLATPMMVWLVFYILTLWYFEPKIKILATNMSEDGSKLNGQIVDSITNALPAKYFAREEYEDKGIANLLNIFSTSYRKMTGTIFRMQATIGVLNAAMVIATAWVGLSLLEQDKTSGLAMLAMALPMAFQATFQSNWIMFEISGIFENLGIVQEGIETLSKEHSIKDREDAHEYKVNKKKADVVFDNITFHYGQKGKKVMENFSLTIPAGQKLGVVGRSGAGKTTLTSLLVRAHDVEEGKIMIGGHSITDMTQQSLRKNITVVTQDSYLFHRSVLENIRYGKPNATMKEVIEAAKKASAHDFIEHLEDNRGRRGYDAHVGERGVKLSGGQKQRISIARAILKNSSILILDEATSALDSESESAIQKGLEATMEGKTVIAIAHRLSTLRQMNRIIVMDQGKIIEDGTHRELVRKGGHYSKLWGMQSGGFLPDDEETILSDE